MSSTQFRPECTFRKTCEMNRHTTGPHCVVGNGQVSGVCTLHKFHPILLRHLGRNVPSVSERRLRERRVTVTAHPHPHRIPQRSWVTWCERGNVQVPRVVKMHPGNTYHILNWCENTGGPDTFRLSSIVKTREVVGSNVTWLVVYNTQCWK